MAGLPHILNSRAGTKYFEPIYPNLFEVSIIAPAAVSGAEILLEHIISISGMNQDKLEGVVEQSFKGAKRSYAQAIPETTTHDIAIQFSLNLDDANAMYVYKILRDWCRLIYNPLTGTQGLKRDYVGTIIVSQYNRAGEIFWRRTFRDCFPTGDAMSALQELSYEGGEPAVLDLTFRSDWFSEGII